MLCVALHIVRCLTIFFSRLLYSRHLCVFLFSFLLLILLSLSFVFHFIMVLAVKLICLVFDALPLHFDGALLVVWSVSACDIFGFIDAVASVVFKSSCVVCVVIYSLYIFSPTQKKKLHIMNEPITNYQAIYSFANVPHF